MSPNFLITEDHSLKTIEKNLGHRACWTDPWLLDTQEKVDWANKIRANKIRLNKNEPWKLNESCPYRPVEAAS